MPVDVDYLMISLWENKMLTEYKGHRIVMWHYLDGVLIDFATRELQSNGSYRMKYYNC